MSRGLFVTFEGGEGAGKTTLIRSLSEKLSDHDREVIVTREPGGTDLGERIRDLLLHRNPSVKVGARAEMLLFLASRLQHLEEKIMPAIKAGKVVLCDRFNDSTVAYQGYARGLGEQWVSKLCSLACEGYRPDLTFVLDLDPTVGLGRSTGSRDRIEEEALAFHLLVRKGFRHIAENEPDRVHLLNAHQSQEEVFIEAWRLLSSKIQSSTT